MTSTRALAFALLLVMAPPAPAGVQLDRLKNVLGKAKQVAGFSLDEDEEIALGEAISAKIRARYGVVQDPEETRYVSLVGMTVVAASDRPDLPWTWVILDSDAVNAFATPGGFVHITRGALAVMGSEAELAGVLAHEAAHVTRKHTVKGLEKSKTLDFAREQAPGGGRTQFLVDALADKATDAILAGFGRKEELDADEVGIALAARAGYAPEGLVEFLTTLAARSGGGNGGGLFRSHPETEERIARAEGQIAADGLAGGVRVEERYAASVPYEVADTSTGAPAVEGARGVAGSSSGAAATTEGDGEQAEGADEGEETESENGEAEEGQKKRRFKLARLANPFGKESEQESAEVTGAGAGRAVGEEGEETGGGPKNPALVEVSITAADLAAFRSEGGLPG